ncbi:hypothetical protein RRG08_046834 [Elysia crispata]|uniref:Uncharacterized protein n=1 Tax=Elysia crispata TaxID=231223 RepID=A0AAE0ZMN2_9GAST|nr:hypothetical protein RRG08_046834 [Elysia crispata]
MGDWQKANSQNSLDAWNVFRDALTCNKFNYSEKSARAALMVMNFADQSQTPAVRLYRRPNYFDVYGVVNLVMVWYCNNLFDNVNHMCLFTFQQTSSSPISTHHRLTPPLNICQLLS